MGDQDEGLLFVEVTVRHVYAFDYNKKCGRSCDGRTPQELIQEFFVDYDINSSHVSRDAHEVGGARVVKEINFEANGVKSKYPLKKKKA